LSPGLRSLSRISQRRFLIDLLAGLFGASYVHLTAIARRDSRHGQYPRLRNAAQLEPGSEHWHMSPVADAHLAQSAAMVQDNTLIAADLTDLSKPHSSSNRSRCMPGRRSARTRRTWPPHPGGEKVPACHLPFCPRRVSLFTRVVSQLVCLSCSPTRDDCPLIPTTCPRAHPFIAVSA
jgi:hypothetical protein